MIDLYYWTTPNGHKITLFLEESGLPYRVHPVNIGRGEQFAPDFLRIAPNCHDPCGSPWMMEIRLLPCTNAVFFTRRVAAFSDECLFPH